MKNIILKEINDFLNDKGIYPDRKNIKVMPSPNKKYGDVSTNFALVCAKKFGKKSLDIAKEFVTFIKKRRGELFSSVEIAGPGFINFKFSDKFFLLLLKKIEDKKENYGKNDRFKGKRVLLEFVSANPTGPLHIGHGRGAVIGDVLGNIFSANGYEVVREYYYNDAGVQMRNLGESLKLRYEELFGKEVKFGKDHYKGDYITDIAKKLKSEVGDKWLNEDLIKFTNYAALHIIKMIDEDLKTLGIKFDSWFKETSLHESGMVDKVLKELEKKGYVYKKEGAYYLKTSNFGDEKDRVVIKKDGNKTYFAPDIAYHKDKFDRGFDLLVDVLGADHHGYIPRLKAAVQILGYKPEQLQIVLIQMVSFKKEGKIMKFSTRQGEFITLKEVMEELSPGIVRYFFAMRKPDAQMIFDWDLAREQSVNNPAYYIQYANARINSVFDKAKEKGIDTAVANIPIDCVPIESELQRDLILHMAMFENSIMNACDNLAPHYICDYLEELARRFHILYNNSRFITSDVEKSRGYLKFLSLVQQVIKNASSIIGLNLPQKM